MSWKESRRGRRRLVITGLAVFGVGAGTVAIKQALAEPVQIPIELEEPVLVMRSVPSHEPPEALSTSVHTPAPRPPRGAKLLSTVRFETQVQRLISHCALARSDEEQLTLLSMEIEPVECGLRIAEIMLRSSSNGGERELGCAQDTLRGLVIPAPAAVTGAPFFTRLVLGMPLEDPNLPEELPAIPESEEDARRMLEQAPAPVP